MWIAWNFKLYNVTRIMVKGIRKEFSLKLIERTNKMQPFSRIYYSSVS